MFTPQERDRVHRQVLEWARTDSRVIAGAVVGSMAHQPGDQFSDIDLTFGVRDECPVAAVLEDWSRRLIEGFDVVEAIAVVAAVADQSRREVSEESGVEGRGDEVWLIR